MEELAKKKDLVITNADKGSGVILNGRENYIKETNHQLSDKASYKQLTLKTKRDDRIVWLIKQ